MSEAVSQKPVLLITGASSGIGEACARSLVEDYRLILVARREDRLKSLVDHIGGSVKYIVADLSDAHALSALPEKILSCFGALDAIINNAGIFIVADHADCTDEQLSSVLHLNLMVPMQLTRDVLPQLRQSSSAHIVNISSHAADASFAGCGVYSASKAGLNAWSRCLREELRADEIRVSVVAPGATHTEIWDGQDTFDTKKMARPEDIAETVALLLKMPQRASVDQVTIMPSGGAL